MAECIGKTSTGQLDSSVDAKCLTQVRSVAQIDPNMVYALKHMSLLLDRLSNHDMSIAAMSQISEVML